MAHHFIPGQFLTVEELDFDLGDRIFIEAVEVSNINGTTSTVKIFKMTATECERKGIVLAGM